jgi:hypothetical protein
MKNSRPAKRQSTKTSKDTPTESPLVAVARGAAAGFVAAAGDFDAAGRILRSNQSGQKKGSTSR